MQTLEFETVTFWIPLRNLLRVCIKKKEMTSQYFGVSWSKETAKWRVQLSIKGEKPKEGGYFKDELDAAKRVNQLCAEFGIPLRNPTINMNPNEQLPVIVYNHPLAPYFSRSDKTFWQIPC